MKIRTNAVVAAAVLACALIASGANSNNSGSNNPNGSGAGRTPPAASANLGASAGDKQVVLTWGSVKRANSYNVYMGTSTNGEDPTPVATNITAITFTKTGLTNGTKYFFKIAAVNSFGTSPPF